VATEELPQGSAPVDGRTQQLTYLGRHVTLASATLLGLGLTTAQRMVDLLLQRVTVCLVHVLGIIPAMLIEARLALATLAACAAPAPEPEPVTMEPASTGKYGS
jgi:hypothetical protein